MASRRSALVLAAGILVIVVTSFLSGRMLPAWGLTLAFVLWFALVAFAAGRLIMKLRRKEAPYLGSVCGLVTSVLSVLFLLVAWLGPVIPILAHQAGAARRAPQRRAELVAQGDPIVQAIVAFEKRTGRLPNALSELVPKDLKSDPASIGWFYWSSQSYFTLAILSGESKGSVVIYKRVAHETEGWYSGYDSGGHTLLRARPEDADAGGLAQ